LARSGYPMTSFTVGKVINLLAAASGAFGTLILFRGSFAYEAPAVWADDKFIEAMKARNHRRSVLQRVGLSFLMISFVLAGIGQLVE
jgi:hypothetical protein